MPLWFAALLFLILAAGLCILLAWKRKKMQGRGALVLAIVLGVLLLIIAAYAILTFVFANAVAEATTVK